MFVNCNINCNIIEVLNAIFYKIGDLTYLTLKILES